MKSVLLSGPLYAGKSSLASCLDQELGFHVIAVRSVIRSLANSVLDDRDALQDFGEQLEKSNPGKWLAAAFEAELTSTNRPIVVDAVRTTAQYLELTEAGRPGVVHVHITASVSARRDRFVSNRDEVDLDVPFETVIKHPIEQFAHELRSQADLVVDSTSLSLEDVCRDVREWLLRET